MFTFHRTSHNYHCSNLAQLVKKTEAQVQHHDHVFSRIPDVKTSAAKQLCNTQVYYQVWNSLRILNMFTLAKQTMWQTSLLADITATEKVAPVLHFHKVGGRTTLILAAMGSISKSELTFSCLLLTSASVSEKNVLATSSPSPSVLFRRCPVLQCLSLPPEGRHKLQTSLRSTSPVPTCLFHILQISLNN